MTLKTFSELFNRAFRYSCSRKKFFFLFAVLSCTSLLFLFFRAVAAFQEPWLQNSLLFIPFFFGMGICLAAQVVLTRLYAKEIQGETLSIKRALVESSELMLKISYLTIPLFLLYLLFWVLSTFFVLLHTIPFVGPFLSVVLAFAPFLLNLLSLLLGLFTLVISFFVCPQIALEGALNRKILFQRISADLFMNLLFFLIPTLCVFFVYKLLFVAVHLTMGSLSLEESTLESISQSFFVMLPFIAVLTPLVNFFFNFAVEAHQFGKLQRGGA